MIDCTERHALAPDSDVAGEGQESMTREAQ